MAKIAVLETSRLKLRQWLPGDYAPFAKLNADTEVMKHYPGTLTELDSNALAKKIESLILQRGWGFWAIELKADSRFIGFAGLHIPQSDLPFSPCVEIGWRLSRDDWGNGYASEAARTVLVYAFETLQLDEVVSFTSLNNARSRAVMQRLNMVNSHQNFEHPDIPVNHPLREHVLFKLTSAQWANVTPRVTP